MAEFSDTANDAPIFMGWLDYLAVANKLPVEAQVFQVWWYATNEQRMNPDADPTPWRAVFASIGNVPRIEQKRRLRRAVERWREETEILADPRTETGSL